MTAALLLALCGCVQAGAPEDYVGQWTSEVDGVESIIELSEDGSASFTNVPLADSESASDDGTWRYSQIVEAVYLRDASGSRVTTVYLQAGPFTSSLLVFVCDPDQTECRYSYSKAP